MTQYLQQQGMRPRQTWQRQHNYQQHSRRQSPSRQRLQPLKRPRHRQLQRPVRETRRTFTRKLTLQMFSDKQ